MLKCVSNQKYTYWLISQETAQEIIDTLCLQEASVQMYSIMYTYEGKRNLMNFGSVVVRKGNDFEVLTQQEFLQKYSTIQ